jgi:murein DD-endopeptidase MepM/ murein hydrolase activator NlpD
MIKVMFTILFAIYCSLNAQAEIYTQLHEEIQKDLLTAQHVEKSPYFDAYTTEVRVLESCLQKADAILEQDQGSDHRTYLKQLRLCETKSKKFDRHYVSAMREVIAKEENALFQLLIETTPRILQRDRWVEKSVAYYKKSKANAPFIAGEKLLKASEIEHSYRQMAAMEMQNYESDVKVFSYEQSRRSRNKEGKQRTFFMAYKKRNSETTLIAENNNAYPVTLLVKLSNVQNYRVDRPLLHHIEVDPFSKTEVMHLRTDNSAKKASFRSSYSWVMGRASARHDTELLYALPFKRDSLVIVSQGFNGQTTHTGRSRYAVDFAAKIGTRVYAAREGKVIATESSFNRGGFGMEFAQYANYVTIEHSDGTMAQYYHLKQYGVAVNVGQHVSKGQFIGLSGNTGYSSGPHLHFGVYKVDSDFHTTVTLPFKFKTNIGVVDSPAKGNLFQVVR